MSSTLIWTGVITACILAAYFIKKYFDTLGNFWPRHGFQVVGTETLGNLFQNTRNPKSLLEVIQTVYNKGKYDFHVPYVGFMQFNIPCMSIIDLDIVKQILVKDFDNFKERNQVKAMSETDPVLSKMLFFMEGEPWKELRPKMSPTFTTGKIKRMFQIFSTSSDKLVEYLEKEADGNNGVVEFKDPYGRYTMDVIASAAFGIDAKTFIESDPIFRRMGKKLQFETSVRLILVILVMVFLPKVAKTLKIGLADKEMVTFFTNVISTAIKHRETTGEKRDDFLQLMLEARNGQLKDEDNNEIETPTYHHGQDTVRTNKAVLTDDVIIAQSLLFILAGFDTTQSVLLFAAYELALNPGIQEELAAELERSWSNNGGKFTYDTINQLEYLDKVVNETLRKYPPVPSLDRKAVNDYKIPGTDLIIPKGAVMFISTYCIHHDEDHFPDPSKFDPERFSPENKNSRHPYAFQAFGHGPRNCIGMRFALTNSKMAVATLVHNFIFETCEKTLIPMKFEKTNTLKPESGLYLKIRKRNTN